METNMMNEEIVEVTEQVAEEVVEKVATSGSSEVLKKAGVVGFALATVVGIAAGVLYIRKKKAKKTEEAAEVTEQEANEEEAE